MKLKKITIQRLGELSLDANEKEEVRQDLVALIKEYDNPESLNYFGVALKEIREEKGLTVETAASLTGIDVIQLKKFESGESKPDAQTIMKITEGLELHPFALTDRALNKSPYFKS